MKKLLLMLLAGTCLGQTARSSRQEAEYYVATYAAHYRLPLAFVRAIVEQESGWQKCAVSPKGAAGLMQLMPGTAQRLGVADRCNVKQNVSGGVRYLEWLRNKFHGDLRLAAAAYYAGERIVALRGLNYSNRDVVAYVASVRQRAAPREQVRRESPPRAPGRKR